MNQTWPTPPRLSARPDYPAPYHHSWRGPKGQWWRPFMSGGIFLGWYGMLIAIAVIVGIFFALSQGTEANFDKLTSLDIHDPAVLALLLGSLIVLIPGVWLAVRLTWSEPFGQLLSVTGKLRGKWLAISVGVVLATWGVVIVGLSALATFTDPDSPGWSIPANWPVMVPIVLFLVPAQSAAEELIFRGWLTKAIGSWIPNPTVSLLVSASVTAALFALAHGSLDPFTLLDLFAFAILASLLVWRTGGLEASIAFHTVNNWFAFALSLLEPESDPLVTEKTTGLPLQVIISLVVFTGIYWLFSVLAKRAKLHRLTTPVPDPRPWLHPLFGGWNWYGWPYNQGMPAFTPGDAALTPQSHTQADGQPHLSGPGYPGAQPQSSTPSDEDVN